MKFANIIVDISHEKLDRPFGYIIPKELEDKISIGTQIVIPFGKGNREITGYVIEITDKPSFDINKMKYIIRANEGAATVEKQLIELAWWIKKEYSCTMNQALKTVIPVKKKIKNIQKKTITLNISEEEAEEKILKYKKSNAKAKVRLLQELKDIKHMSKELVVDKLNISPSTLKALESTGDILIEIENSYRNPVNFNNLERYDIILNEQQKAVADSIKKTMDYKKSEKANVHLIYGITGSGKTEVYMDIIDKTIHDGKQAIVLIPEIALTYQTVKRFTRRFKDKVSIINSKLSAGEKYDQFERAKRGEISIIIGPRSALFTPFENLGLIVIDEEHEGAYKSENVPKYHAREVAAKLCNITGATLVLGSATPSLESYFNAQTGKYKLHRLTSREKGKLAQVSVVDMRKELKNDNKSMFSMELKQLINDRLEKKQQTMLFINRRGYAGFVSCRECGEAVKCPHCDVTLKAHNNGKMVCHYCGYEEPIPRLCPKCGSKYIAGFGIGTQKVETMIKKEFPQAKVLRMDFDTTSRKGGHEEILSAFANHQADILVGTQMIVKGHDFPDVTLVGILAADMSLYASDYTAAEKTFQLLTQAAGRAGRGKVKGQVVIQTYSPDNYSIESAAKQDYEEFYQEELAYRQLMQYPPVAAMTEILIQSEDEELLDRFTDALTKYINKLKEAKFKQLMIIGPAKPPVAKINDVYRRMIYLKSLDKEKLIRMSDYIQELINTSQKVKGITLQFNVRE